MIKLEIPYGKTTLSYEGSFSSYEFLLAHGDAEASVPHQEDLITQAMKAPIGGIPLSQMAKGKHSAVIIISDHTRPVPSRLILPPMLAALREGSPDIDVTLLVATGCHRATTLDELKQKLGSSIYAQEKIIVHDCDNSANMVNLGTLPSGTECRVNRIAVETDLLVAEGFIEPHFFAGFSGGRKSVLPGICARKTVMANHCAAFIDNAGSRSGLLQENLIHRDMTAAARMAKLQFIVNVVLSPDKRVIHAVAGEPVKAHAAGCGWLSRRCRVTPQMKGDLVITSNGGAPLDQNIYQAVKCMSTAEAAVAPGGTIIVCSECADGIGGDAFYHAVRDCASASALLDRIRKVAPEKTTPDQWQYQIFCRILKEHRIIFVTRPELRDVITDMKMEYASTLGEAIQRAEPENKHVVIIPDGVSVIVA